MKVLRRLILPALVSAILIPGLFAMTLGRSPLEIQFGLQTLYLFLGIGLAILGFGLPSALWLARFKLSAAMALPLLIAIGAIGGGIIAIIASRNFQFGMFGLPLGAGIALIWTLFNSDLFARNGATR